MIFDIWGPKGRANLALGSGESARKIDLLVKTMKLSWAENMVRLSFPLLVAKLRVTIALEYKWIFGTIPRFASLGSLTDFLRTPFAWFYCVSQIWFWPFTRTTFTICSTRPTFHMHFFRKNQVHRNKADQAQRIFGGVLFFTWWEEMNDVQMPNVPPLVVSIPDFHDDTHLIENSCFFMSVEFTRTMFFVFF